jgi:hypothetical protein
MLFVCVGNQGRSVMAERLFRRGAAGRHKAQSAGSNPGSAVHPQVLEVLDEIGLNARDHVPRKLDNEDVAWAELRHCPACYYKSMPSLRSSTSAARRQRIVSGENGSVNGIPFALRSGLPSRRTR